MFIVFFCVLKVTSYSKELYNAHNISYPLVQLHFLPLIPSCSVCARMMQNDLANFCSACFSDTLHFCHTSHAGFASFLKFIICFVPLTPTAVFHFSCFFQFKFFNDFVKFTHSPFALAFHLPCSSTFQTFCIPASLGHLRVLSVLSIFLNQNRCHAEWIAILLLM